MTMLFEERHNYYKRGFAAARKLEDRRTVEPVGHGEQGRMVFSVSDENGTDIAFTHLLEDALLVAIDEDLDVIKVWSTNDFENEAARDLKLQHLDTLDVNTVIRRCARFLFSESVTYSRIPGESRDMIHSPRSFNKSEYLDYNAHNSYGILLFRVVNSQCDVLTSSYTLYDALISALEQDEDDVTIQVLEFTQDHFNDETLEPYFVENLDVKTLIWQFSSIRPPLEYSNISFGGFDVVY